MKLEKREITLNEYDSLYDAFLMQRTLLSEYIGALENASRQETRKELLRLMTQAGEDLFFLRDLMEKSTKDGEE